MQAFCPTKMGCNGAIPRGLGVLLMSGDITAPCGLLRWHHRHLVQKVCQQLLRGIASPVLNPMPGHNPVGVVPKPDKGVTISATLRMVCNGRCQPSIMLILLVEGIHLAIDDVHHLGALRSVSSLDSPACWNLSGTLFAEFTSPPNCFAVTVS